MPAQGAIRDGNGAGLALIETLRWEPGAGFIRMARHLARLGTSAHALGFEMEPGRVEESLLAAGTGTAPLRVRLSLETDGSVHVTSQPYAPLAPDAAWTLRLAGTRIDSADPLLSHKTTRRQVYDAARAEFSRGEADEVVLLNERGELCEGTITNLFLDAGGGGPLLTPAAHCGLLPGVLRAEMLERGEAVEAVLGLEDLRRAAAVFVGNSLRGLIAGRLAASGN